MRLVLLAGPLLGIVHVCKKILGDLSNWFGIEEANKKQANKSETLPTFIAKIESETVGSMSLLIHFPQSA
jgi:hypothetical protein